MNSRSEEEVRLASDLRAAREAFAELVRRLPEPWRSRVLPEGDTKGPELGRRWPLQRLDASYKRLLECSHEPEARQIAAILRDAKRYKQSIDRARNALVVKLRFGIERDEVNQCSSAP